jgi:hypothetical protein
MSVRCMNSDEDCCSDFEPVGTFLQNQLRGRARGHFANRGSSRAEFIPALLICFSFSFSTRIREFIENCRKMLII